MSRRAFTITSTTEHIGGVRLKTGQYIAVKNDPAKKTVPLEYPERKALYKMGDHRGLFKGVQRSRPHLIQDRSKAAFGIINDVL